LIFASFLIHAQSRLKRLFIEELFEAFFAGLTCEEQKLLLFGNEIVLRSIPGKPLDPLECVFRDLQHRRISGRQNIAAFARCPALAAALASSHFIGPQT
jgi:hypothetical protein